jgi:hypothetical protein
MFLRQNSTRISLLLPHPCHIARPSHPWFDHPSDNSVTSACHEGRSQWPRGLRPFACWDAVLNTAGAWLPVCCECFALSGTGLCEGPITHPEESYRVWSRTSKWDTLGPLCATEPWKKWSFSWSSFLRSAVNFSVVRSHESLVLWKLGFLVWS